MLTNIRSPRTKEERAKQETALEKYWREAKSFVKLRTNDPKDPPWFAFEFQSPVRSRWEQYFHWRLGFCPVGLHLQEQGKITEFLVPCEDPQEFDPGYKL